MTNKAIISIGSNYERTQNIRMAIQRLQVDYPDTRFSTPEITDPIDLPEGAKPFLNLVAVVKTEYSQEVFVEYLKTVETEMGREEEDEEEGIVVIDIDLIEWNDEVIKPHDLVRPYVVAGLEELDEF
ncbi:2-amino-4-hydroxy-6-hydroxymethyldihydropteridine diphosphokinase [Porphyromonas circumdentaria]|uniref:2-amino-4-hydroxy-6-hydroxymethyldihydropteridine pyrophosphokinase n=1 Tax=Porphyromonas circumdentaria TaxID=29524 RepID=A0A1T4MCD6_9PORP|nr:2-amino-4-hydroxy-6-hydroxymethyldihydropteridine diphosphokinase [Porphyromonas circumdentaria]MBB6275820.1 2-amino-4-hydroxy-6-hydroxymethyldihydropteridine diphosphokinase [Porphyromonas circumdentaria]SJZ64536.1 2-amino-4-hydroxy-6-hydroxymethyldihydropteridinediphosphokinase [Porphyromonas circumdentaria]